MIDSYPTINLKHIANSTCIIMSKASNQDVASDSAASSAKSSAAAAMVPLPDDFTPCNADVLCGRGKKNYNSIGNQRLRRIVDSYVEQYQAAASRQDKSDILSEIVDQVRSASPKGGFVKQDPVTNKWFEVGDFLAREKVSQAFRDALAFQYRSSKKFKHEKRRQRDRAAKLFAQQQRIREQKNAGGGGGQKGSKGPLTPAAAASKVLAHRQRLAILREEPMMPSTTFVPPGQANQSPGEMRQRFPHSAAAAETGLSPVPYQSTSPDKRQQQILQSSLSHEQQQLHRFNNQGLPLPDTLVGNRHASWPQMLPPNSHLFNPVHTHETIAQQQQHQQHHQQQQFHPLHRRYSDAVMQDAATSSVRQDVAASHRRYSDAMMHDAPANMISFHQSEPSFPTWSLPSMEGGDQYPGMPGMSQQQQREHFYYPSGGCMMMGPPGYTSPSNFANYPQTNTSLNDPPAAANLMRRQRPKPIQRGDSSVAASAIVSRMSGALQDNEFPQYNDHDPFEPMPLPAEEGNYDNEGEPSQQPW